MVDDSSSRRSCSSSTDLRGAQFPRRQQRVLPSSISPWSKCPRSENSASAAKWGECGRPVKAETPFTDALKINFDHCAGRASCSASALSPPCTRRSAASLDHGVWRVSRLEGSKPGRRVQFVLDMGIAVPGSAHESGSADNVSTRVLGDDFLAAQTVLGGNQCSLIKSLPCCSDRLLHLRRLGSDDPEIEVRQFTRIVSCTQPYRKIVRTRNPEPVAIQSLSVFFRRTSTQTSDTRARWAA